MAAAAVGRFAWTGAVDTWLCVAAVGAAETVDTPGDGWPTVAAEAVEEVEFKPDLDVAA